MRSSYLKYIYLKIFKLGSVGYRNLRLWAGVVILLNKHKFFFNEYIKEEGASMCAMGTVDISSRDE